MLAWIKRLVAQREPGFHENVDVEDNVQLILRGPDGKIKSERSFHNVYTTVGREGTAAQLLTTPAFEKPTHVAIGTGSTAAAEADTALVTETKRVALATKTRSAKVVTITATFAAGEGTGNLRECGIFNAASVGSLFARQVFGSLEKEAADSLEVIWTLTIG